MARYRTNVALAVKGERIEKGTEIDLEPEHAAIYDPADLTPVGAISAPEAEAPLADTPLEEMSVAQLKARATELGLAASGTKADLTERITLHLAGNTDQPATAGQGAEESANDQPATAGQGEVTSA